MKKRFPLLALSASFLLNLILSPVSAARIIPVEDAPVHTLSTTQPMYPFLDGRMARR